MCKNHGENVHPSIYTLCNGLGIAAYAIFLIRCFLGDAAFCAGDVWVLDGEVWPGIKRGLGNLFLCV